MRAAPDVRECERETISQYFMLSTLPAESSAAAAAAGAVSVGAMDVHHTLPRAPLPIRVPLTLRRGTHDQRQQQRQQARRQRAMSAPLLSVREDDSGVDGSNPNLSAAVTAAAAAAVGAAAAASRPLVRDTFVSVCL